MKEGHDIPGAKLVRLLRLDALPLIVNLALGELTLFGPKAITTAELDALPPEEQNTYQAVKSALLKG